MRSAKQLLPLLGAAILLLVVFRIFVPQMLRYDNLLNLGVQIAVNAILAFGMTQVILIGGIDLSVGAVLALAGTVAVSMFPEVVGGGADLPAANLWSTLAAMSCGLAVAAAFGAFHGVCAAYTRMPPFIITLATMEVARGMALRFNDGQPITIPGSQRFFLALGNGRLGFLPVPVLVMAAVFGAIWVLQHRTRYGQHLYAMGGNPEAARFTGIPLARRTIAVYTLCSLLAGVAAMLHTAQLYSAEPGSGVGFELSAIAAVVVGGTSLTGGSGSVPGTLLGAVIIGILDKGLNMAGVHYSYQHVAKGVVILAAVYLDVRRKVK